MTEATLYLEQMELGPMQNFVYLSEGGVAPLRCLPLGTVARAKPALGALRGEAGRHSENVALSGCRRAVPA